MKINEAFNYASYMDVSELRRLYYGRDRVYVYFSDSVFEDRSGRVRGRMVRPTSTVMYSVSDVVARKVSTPYLYAHINRVNTRGWVNDIRAFDRYTLDKDIEKLKKSKIVDQELVTTVTEYVLGKNKLTRAFDILWEITRRLAENNPDRWNAIFLELGYTGFGDPSGIGTLGKKESMYLSLDQKEVRYLDSLTIQKYRKDKRLRTRTGVERKRDKEYNITAANRVAKRRRG